MKNGEGKKKFNLKVKRYPDTSLLPQFICSGSLGALEHAHPFCWWFIG